MDVKDKVAVVTGGAQGIGLALCTRFAQEGAPGFKNRVSAVANWTGAFLGRGRRQRTITKQQTLARTEVLELATWSPRGTDQGLHGRNSGATARTSCVLTHSLERRFS